MPSDETNAVDNPSSMSIRYRNTPEDLLMLYEFSIRHSWSYQAARTIGTSLSMFFVGYVLFLVYRGQRNLDTAFFVLFAASLMASLGRDAVKRTVRRSVERMTRASLHPRELRIDEEGLWFEDQPGVVEWQRVLAVMSNEHVIMIFFDRSAEVVPTRVFQDPFEAAAFADLARQYQAEFGPAQQIPSHPAPPAEQREP